MSYVHPKIEKFIEWMKTKIAVKKLKVMTLVVTIFLFLDCMLTGYALEMFFIRKVHDYDLNVVHKDSINVKYDEIYGNEKTASFIDKFFGDKKMIKTFPNLKTQDINGEIIYFDCYVGDISPYYYVFSFSKMRDR